MKIHMKTHPADLVSLVTGLVSIAIAVVALAGGLTVDVLATDWVWPSLLIALGLLVLATAGMGRRRPTTEPAPDQPAPAQSAAGMTATRPDAVPVQGATAEAVPGTDAAADAPRAPEPSPDDERDGG
jgi:hypothetical protein